MKKVYAFYFATIGCLFLALFAAFSMAGLGSELVAFEEPSPVPETDAAPPPEPISFARGIDYPDLHMQQMYSVSHTTPIFSDPEGLFDRQEELPPGGIFFVEDKEEFETELWYRVAVNSGDADYSMYLKAVDLNWKDVQPVVFAGSKNRRSREETLARFYEALGVDPHAAMTPPEPEPEPEPEVVPSSAERMVASARASIRNASSKGIASAAMAAGICTLGIALAISVLVWIRRAQRWDASPLFEEIAAERGEEFYEDPVSDESRSGDF